MYFGSRQVMYQYWSNVPLYQRNLAFRFHIKSYLSLQRHGLNIYRLLKAGVHNSNLIAGQIFFDISKGQSWLVLTHSKGVFIKETSKLNKIWGFVGQIKSFHGPHLTRRPYVVHAWLKIIVILPNLPVGEALGWEIVVGIPEVGQRETARKGLRILKSCSRTIFGLSSFSLLKSATNHVRIT